MPILETLAPLSPRNYSYPLDPVKPPPTREESVEALLDDLSPKEREALSRQLYEIAEDAEYRTKKEEGTPQSPIYRALAALALTQALFVELRIQGNQSLLDHIVRYTDLTRSEVNWKYAQAGILAASGLVAGGLGIASGLYVTHSPTVTPGDHLKGTALSASSRLFSTLGDAGKTLADVPITERESARAIISQVGFQSDQGRRDIADEVLRRSSQFLLTIIEQNGRGG